MAAVNRHTGIDWFCERLLVERHAPVLRPQLTRTGCATTHIPLEPVNNLMNQPVSHLPPCVPKVRFKANAGQRRVDTGPLSGQTSKIVSRATSFAACLCLWGLLCPLRAQPTPQALRPPDPATDPLPPPPQDVQQPPAPPSPATDAPPPAPDSPATNAQPAQPDNTPPPLPEIPTGALPLTPAEQREKDIDKFDPMKPLEVPGQQDANPLTDRKVPPPRTRSGSQPAPLPGSLAAMTAAQATPGGSDAASPDDPTASDSPLPAGVEYSGPAVLSRSYTLARPMIPRQLNWQATVGLSYSWNQGQAPIAVDGGIGYTSTSSQSLGYRWGLSGRHIWRHDQLGLSYAGNYSAYGTNGLSGINHLLNLDYGHVISRRLSFQVTESLQELSQNYALENPTLQPGNSIANIDLGTSPSVQLLNSITRQSSTSASMTFRQTARLSYNLSGSSFIVGRSIGIGASGRQAGGDVNYRWTRRATVGAYYSYTSYSYPHNIANSDSHGVGLIFSYALDRSTQIQSRIGVTRIESLAYTTVPLPPLLAALLGQPVTIINAYTLLRTSDISLQLVKDFRRTRTASLAYAHGQSPGNGVLLTSIQQTISAGYSAAFLKRRLPISAGVVFSTLASTSQSNISFFKSEAAYVGTSRKLKYDVESSLNFTYSRFRTTGIQIFEHTMSVSLGLSWSPPRNALRFLQ